MIILKYILITMTDTNKITFDVIMSQCMIYFSKSRIKNSQLTNTSGSIQSLLNRIDLHKDAQSLSFRNFIKSSLCESSGDTLLQSCDTYFCNNDTLNKFLAGKTPFDTFVNGLCLLSTSVDFQYESTNPDNKIFVQFRDVIISHIYYHIYPKLLENVQYKKLIDNDTTSDTIDIIKNNKIWIALSTVALVVSGLTLYHRAGRLL